MFWATLVYKPSSTNASGKFCLLFFDILKSEENPGKCGKFTCTERLKHELLNSGIEELFSSMCENSPNVIINYFVESIFKKNNVVYTNPVYARIKSS